MSDLMYDEDEVVSSGSVEHAMGSVEGWPMLNHTGLGDDILMHDPNMREIASKLSSWVDNARNAAGRSSMFDRGAYTPPDNFYKEVVAARHAMKHDDIVQGVYEITESFAFQGTKWESEESDDADVFNQIAADIDLDSVIRRMWMEQFSVSQFVVAQRWGQRKYTVRGKGEKGRSRRKEYDIWVPTSLHILDSTKVVPVMHGPLGSDALAWSSTPSEFETWDRVVKGQLVDPELIEFYMGRYSPDDLEAGELSKLGVDIENLMLLNPTHVWRHTITKPDYERFPNVRLRSIFHLLDMKRQLLAADRAALVGMANYILLVKKGDDKRPATPAEMENLTKNYNFIAKMPVIISDHRLEVEIIAPKVDFVLNGEKYDTLDSRILSRLLGTLSIASKGQRNETQVTLSAAVAKGMENRRHMLKRSIERNLARAIFRHPRNDGAFVGNVHPKLVYTPRMITLAIDAATISAIMQLRQGREVSRETTLEYFGIDQATEAQRMEEEDELYDDIFNSFVPFSGVGPGGQPQPPGATGAQGGRPTGGGDSANSTKAKVKPKTASGNPSTAK